MLYTCVGRSLRCCLRLPPDATPFSCSMIWFALALAILGALLLMLILGASLAPKIPEYHGDDYLVIDEAASHKAAYRVQRPLQTAPPLAHAAGTTFGTGSGG